MFLFIIDSMKQVTPACFILSVRFVSSLVYFYKYPDIVLSWQVNTGNTAHKYSCAILSKIYLDLIKVIPGMCGYRCGNNGKQLPLCLFLLSAGRYFSFFCSVYLSSPVVGLL